MPTSTVTSAESRWLEWARPIVTMSSANPDHLRWCRSKLGGAEYGGAQAEDEPTLRWPGYVGGDWREGAGVLFVGSVHSDFGKENGRAPSSSRRATVDRLATANVDWRSVPRSTAADERYLRETQSCYQELAPGWTRGAIIGLVLEGAYPGLPAEQRFARAAWTNLAHCRAVPRSISEYGLQRACSGRTGAFPIGRLVDAIRPALVVASVRPVATVYSESYDWGADPPRVVAFSGGGRAAGYVGQQRPDAWIPEVVSFLRSLVI